MTARHVVPAERCNIGPAEIARRRWVAATITIATLLVVLGLLASHAPASARVVVFPFAAGTAISWLQVFRRFCVRFGALGLENFGAMGEERPVDRDIRRTDARRALEMVLEGLLFGIVVTLAVLQLPY